MKTLTSTLLYQVCWVSFGRAHFVLLSLTKPYGKFVYEKRVSWQGGVAKCIKYRLHRHVYTKLKAIKLCHGQSLIIIDKIPTLVLPLRLHSHAEWQIIQYFTPAEVFTQLSFILHEELKVDVLCSLAPELIQAGGILWCETRC